MGMRMEDLDLSLAVRRIGMGGDGNLKQCVEVGEIVMLFDCEEDYPVGDVIRRAVGLGESDCIEIGVTSYEFKRRFFHSVTLFWIRLKSPCWFTTLRQGSHL